MTNSTGVNSKVPDRESLIQKFVAAAEGSRATVERLPHSPESLKGAVQHNLAGSGKALLAEPDDLPPELWAPLRDLEQVIEHPTDDQLRSVSVGITDAFAGVARTGSVCVAMTGNLGGAVSLFPRRHIAVLEARNIVPRPGDVLTAGQLENKGLERSFVFITGPSVTADMGELVQGVHGPDHLHIIILEE
ncbi:MAG: hypothetical protein GH143_07840 [Calditrichaeota bacterium]|nr:hypothetical protein [Calditrichota bacterium]